MMRERTPLLALQQGVKAAAPARDFIGALRAKAAETGAGAAHRAVVLHGVRHGGWRRMAAGVGTESVCNGAVPQCRF